MRPLDCRALRWEAASAAGWLSAYAISAIAGMALAWSLPWRLPVAAAIAVAAGAGAVYTLSQYSRRRRRLRLLCRACRDPVPWPRRTSYTCRVGEAVLCYSYALDRFYAYRVRGEERRLRLLEGLDYYCAKMLGGRLEERGEVRVYRGRLEALSDKRGWLLVGEGVMAYAPARLGPEAVLGEVQGS